MITSILLLLQCEPLERQWNDWVPGSCPHVLRTTNAGYFAGSKSISPAANFFEGRRGGGGGKIGEREARNANQ